MKVLLIYILLVSFFAEIKNKGSYIPVKSPEKPTSTDSIPTGTDIIDFNTRIKPIFVSRCSPCHFSGGKMYERLPFDKDVTLVNNVDKIMKRVEKDEKKAIVKEFLLQVKKEQTTVQKRID